MNITEEEPIDITPVDPIQTDAFVNENVNFDDVFGSFDTKAIEEPLPVETKVLDDGRAHPCNDCGLYPTIHNSVIRKNEIFKNRFYISCDTCSMCDGNWYDNEDEAIAAWNELNPLTEVEVDKKRVAMRDFVDDIMSNIKSL